jgi:hypothetical protein
MVYSCFARFTPKWITIFINSPLSSSLY